MAGLGSTFRGFAFFLGSSVFFQPYSRANCLEQLRKITQAIDLELQDTESTGFFFPQKVLDFLRASIGEKLGLELPEDFSVIIWGEPDHPEDALKTLIGPLKVGPNTPPEVRKMMEEAEALGADVFSAAIAFPVGQEISTRRLNSANWVGSFFLADGPTGRHLITLSPANKFDPWVLEHEIQHLRDYSALVDGLKKLGLTQKEVSEELTHSWSSPRGHFLTERNAVIAEIRYQLGAIKRKELSARNRPNDPLQARFTSRILYPLFSAMTLSTRQVATFFETKIKFNLGPVTDAEIADRLKQVAALLEPIFWKEIIVARAHFLTYLDQVANLPEGSEPERVAMANLIHFVKAMRTWKGATRQIGVLRDYVEYSKSLDSPIARKLFKSLPLADKWNLTILKYLKKNPYGRNPNRPDFFSFVLENLHQDPEVFSKELVKLVRDLGN